MEFLLVIVSAIVLGLIAWNDLRYYAIPDYLSLGGGSIILLLQVIIGLNLKNILLGVFVGVVFFLLQYIFLGKDWLGLGDVFLGGLIGLILGWPQVLIGIAAAYIFGAIVALFLLAMKYKKISSPIPLGAFLSITTMGIIFWNFYSQ